MTPYLFKQRLGTNLDRATTILLRQADSGAKSTKHDSRLLDRRIHVVVTQLENSSHQQIGIEDMARLVNLSPSRLAHLFKSETKLTIQQYLTRLRLARARQQLESTFLSIKEIAASVGFSSVTRFVTCFKDLVGTTPAQYRKQFSMVSYQVRSDSPVARSANT
jgi:transcriptional regulator GlxA family with amidase domain